VNALPGFVSAIAAIDGGLARPTTTTSREPEPVPSPARPLAANTLVPAAGRFDVVGLVSDALVIEGPVTFAPTTLVSVALEVEPPLRVWATVTHTGPSSDGGHRVHLMPFALDENSHRRWRLLLADQAAERTRQTLRKMESPKKP
jgi:hypothetical protein